MSAASDPKTRTTLTAADADRTVAMREPAPADAAVVGSNVLPPGTQLAEFTVSGVIGEGGFGIVYRAEDRALRRTVAIKEYMPSALAARLADTRVVVKSEQHRETFEIGLKSFINEARLLAQFDHPALVKVFRFWAANGTAYMAMPLYEGGTLKQALKRMGTQPDEAWLKKLLVPLLDAIELLHQADCLHRDIAPDNVLMGPGSTESTPRPVLLDFGAARRVLGGVHGNVTQALTVILKPGYAPIEQYDEIPGMKQGPWTDLYALGAVIHTAIHGRPPPPSVGRLVQDAWVPLSHSAAGRYSAGFLAAVDAVLAARPEARPRSVVQWRAMLTAGSAAAVDASTAAVTRAEAAPVEHAATVTAAVATDASPAAARPTRWLRAVGAGAVAGMAVIGATWVVLTQPARDTQRAQVQALTQPGTASARATGGAVPAPLPAASTPSSVASAAVPVAESAQSTAPSPTLAALPEPAAPATARTAPVRAEPSRSPPARPPAATGTITGTTAGTSAGTTTAAAPVTDNRARVAPPLPTPPAALTPSTASVAPTAWIDIALREGRACFAERQYACTIARAEAVLKSEPGHAAAQAMLRDGRAAQEAALAGDWKMR